MNLNEKIERLDMSTSRLRRIAKIKGPFLYLSDAEVAGDFDTWHHILRREAWINLKRSLAVFWAVLRHKEGE